MKSQKQKHVRRIYLVVAATALVVIAVVLVVLEKTHVINLYSRSKPTTTNDTAKTTSTAPSAQDTFTSGDDKSTSSSNKQEGVVQDTSGQAATPTDSSTWTTSKDSKITVYTPTTGGLIKSGDTISGSSSLSMVSFRLIDDVSGVISQGSLTVKDGKFSGTFNFSTTGTNGRLDIFSAAVDGTESSNIGITIRFK